MTVLVGAIDQGTTSTRFTLVDHGGNVVAMAQREHHQLYPRPGWVEHDALEIWENTQKVIGECLATAGFEASDLRAVGITNERETTLVWDADTGEPLTPAIVWQDTRTEALCGRLGGSVGPDRFRATTGLPLATYFSAPKLRWLLDEVPGLRASAEAGKARFGTMDSWLIWNLTGRHATDVTNASRTMLMALDSLDWDDGLLEAFGVPRVMLPEIVPSISEIGVCRGVLDGVPLGGVLGDQQSAMFGQAATEPGDAKNTYGTGCFLLVNTGMEPVASDRGLLTTVAYQTAGQPARYALEGSVAIAGAGVQWLRDNLRLIDSASEVEALAASVEDNGGVYLVPAFSGLFAPHWRADARGVIVGLTQFAGAGHIARAMLEAVAFQLRDVVDVMTTEAGRPFTELKVDGGMVRNELLMQFSADLLDIPVVVPEVIETTVVGAAYAAGIATGFWSGFDEVRTNWREAHRYQPAMTAEQRTELTTGWSRALDRSLDWVET